MAGEIGRLRFGALSSGNACETERQDTCDKFIKGKWKMPKQLGCSIISLGVGEEEFEIRWANAAGLASGGTVLVDLNAAAALSF